MAGKKKNNSFSINLLDGIKAAAVEAEKVASIAVVLTKWGHDEKDDSDKTQAIEWIMDELLTKNMASDTVERLANSAIPVPVVPAILEGETPTEKKILAIEKAEKAVAKALQERKSFVSTFEAAMRTAAKYNGKRKLNFVKKVNGLSGTFMVLGAENSFKERTKDNSEGKIEKDAE